MNTPHTPPTQPFPPRWQERYGQFCHALATLADVVPRAQELNELEKDGLLQRFEFTFELAWKVMQDYLHHTGQSHIKGPRPVLAEMANNDPIDPFLWEEMLTTRNKLSHVYSEEQSRIFVEMIVMEFFSELENFRHTMQAMQAMQTLENGGKS
jgi:nucleotidyltransferase substrate binding protein (TIGR01987 family)